MTNCLKKSIKNLVVLYQKYIMKNMLKAEEIFITIILSKEEINERRKDETTHELG